MEGRERQARDGGQKSGSGKTGRQAAVIRTVPFTCPSTGAILHTIKPDFGDVAAYINMVMADYPDVEALSQDERAGMEAAVTNKMLDYFTRYCVRLTHDQFIEGGKAVVAGYKKAGLKQRPDGKTLIKAIVFWVYCPQQHDRWAFLAHMSQLSGLAPFNKEAARKELAG